MKDTKKHGHPKNAFHKVDRPGMSTSFYISGEEQDTLTAALHEQGEIADKASLAKLARLWFHEMMEARKHEFLESLKTDR